MNLRTPGLALMIVTCAACSESDKKQTVVSPPSKGPAGDGNNVPLSPSLPALGPLGVTTKGGSLVFEAQSAVLINAASRSPQILVSARADGASIYPALYSFEPYVLITLPSLDGNTFKLISDSASPQQSPKTLAPGSATATLFETDGRCMEGSLFSFDLATDSSAAFSLAKNADGSITFALATAKSYAGETSASGVYAYGGLVVSSNSTVAPTVQGNCIDDSSAAIADSLHRFSETSDAVYYVDVTGPAPGSNPSVYVQDHNFLISGIPGAAPYLSIKGTGSIGSGASAQLCAADGTCNITAQSGTMTFNKALASDMGTQDPNVVTNRASVNFNFTLSDQSIVTGTLRAPFANSTWAN